MDRSPPQPLLGGIAAEAPTAYTAKLTSFHTASQDNKCARAPAPAAAPACCPPPWRLSPLFVLWSTLWCACSPFTVYVVAVLKDGQQWQVFRRFKEWEYLRERLQHTCGNAPPFPGKVLFGRMRPEVRRLALDRTKARPRCVRVVRASRVSNGINVRRITPSAPQVIETRVLGLNAFLQMVLSSPTYAASTDLVEFLERDRNLPPPGLDLMLDPHDAPDTSSAEGTAEGTRQAMLKRLVEAASQAFISVSQEPPALDATYLNDRAASYASTLRPAIGPPAGSMLPLKPPPGGSAPSPAALEEVMQRLLTAPPTDPAETALVKATAAGAAAALGGIAVQGKYEVLCVMSQGS